LGSPKGCLWQKPGHCLIFNCPDLSFDKRSTELTPKSQLPYVWANYMDDIYGFSQIPLVFDEFLDQSYLLK
jgi:hypothetical protein